MDEESKSRLEELQAEIKLQTGEKVAQQEILSRLVEEAYGSKSEFVDSFRETTVPLSEAERDAFHCGILASGAETSVDDIDDVLYR